MSVILGVNAFHAGASAALLVDGVPVMAIAEERLNRAKYYAGFPSLAVQRCLDAAGVGFKDVDHVALGRDKSANRAQKLAYVARNPSKLLNLAKIRAARSELDDLKTLLAKHCNANPEHLRFTQHDVEHHIAHTASAYFISPWEHATGLTIDGSGDFGTCVMSECIGDQIKVKQRIHVPNSLGSFYSMVCEFIGYDRYGDEGKVMGLAPLGQDAYHDEFQDIVTATATGLQLNPKYFLPFGANQGVLVDDSGTMQMQRHHSDEMVARFGPARKRGDAITQRDENIAHSLQVRFEEIYMHLLRLAHGHVPTDRVCLAGGCALNSVANGKLFDATPFRETAIQPAAGDDGLALGAALHVSNAVLREGKRWVMQNAYLGGGYSDEVIRETLEARGIKYEKLGEAALLERTVDEIERGNVVGWFQGRSEWGPRALGNRSILAHPGLPDMKDVLNARIKHREAFRPFAPSIMEDKQAEVFECGYPSPFMLHVYKIRPEWRDRLCAVNHLDNTGRLQSVSPTENPLYYALIENFYRRTGIPIILNTSFNENEPVVEHPSEAADCYLRTKMDVLVLGSYFCTKATAETA